MTVLLGVIVAWFLIGLLIAVYYRRTRDYVEHYTNTGIITLLLTLGGPMSLCVFQDRQFPKARSFWRKK